MDKVLELTRTCITKYHELFGDVTGTVPLDARAILAERLRALDGEAFHLKLKAQERLLLEKVNELNMILDYTELMLQEKERRAA